MESVKLKAQTHISLGFSECDLNQLSRTGSKEFYNIFSRNYLVVKEITKYFETVYMTMNGVTPIYSEVVQFHNRKDFSTS